MKLSVDARKLYDSGIGSVIRNILHNLAKTDYQLSLVCKLQDDLNALGYPSNWNYRRVASAGYSVSEQFTMPWALSGSDLAWIPHYNIPLASSVPLVTTIHDVLPLAMPEYFGGMSKQVYAHAMFRAAVMKSHLVTCVSNFTAQEVMRFLGCPAKKIRVIPNGVSEEWFNLTVNPAQNSPYLLFIGNVKPHKNIRRMIEAFLMIEKKIPHRLVIIGQRDGFITGDASLNQQLSSPRIEFTGPLPQETLMGTMAGASGFVFPSLYEGFGLPPLEAMAAGIPVAASNTTATAEICGDAVIGFNPHRVDEIAEAMLQLCTLNASRYAQMVDAGRKRARMYSWGRSANMLMQVFEEVG